MALPTFASGSRVRASALTALVAELQNLFSDTLKVIKPADSPARTNNTLAVDPDLSLALLASTSYDFTFKVFYGSNATADIQFAVAFPTGAAVTWGGQRIVTAASPSGDMDAGIYVAPTSAVSPIAAAGTGGDTLIMIEGTIVTGVTAGNVTLWWAQNTTNVSGAIVRARSTATARRIRSAP